MLYAAPPYLANFGEPVSITDLIGHYLLATDSQLPWRLDGPDGALVVNRSSHIRSSCPADDPISQALGAY